MRGYLGAGATQWEHARKWDLAAAASEFTRADGALLVPGGFDSLSVFFRRASQSASTFELSLWTAPVFLRPLDDDLSANPTQYLYLLSLSPATGLQMTGTTAQLFAARVNSGLPMGTLLFWQMKNTGGVTGNIVGDVYVVPNHGGTMQLARLGRTIDVGDGGVAGPGVTQQMAARARGGA